MTYFNKYISKSDFLIRTLFLLSRIYRLISKANNVNPKSLIILKYGLFVQIQKGIIFKFTKNFVFTVCCARNI